MVDERDEAEEYKQAQNGSIHIFRILESQSRQKTAPLDIHGHLHTAKRHDRCCMHDGQVCTIGG